MKKMRLYLLTVLLLFGVAGCGHKSNRELVDVEQFKCQDSIETVFNVLGETELKEYGYPSYLENDDIAYYERGYYIIFADIQNPRYYMYENVNLFGFNGYVVFDVREDKETIQGIYCNLTLTDEEFKEVIAYFMEKYGSYEVDSFGDTIKTYEWIISEEDGEVGYEADEIGFDSVVIENRGDDKYIIAFNDEWSFVVDETYYKEVEESKETENETSDAIAKGEYDICGDSIRLYVIPKDDEYEFVCYGTAQNKANANVLTTMLYATCESMKDTFAEYSIMVSCEDGGSIILSWDGSSYITMGVNEDGSASFSTPDWYTGENSMSESEMLVYLEALKDAFDEFALEIKKANK